MEEKTPKWIGKFGADKAVFYLRDRQEPENWVTFTGPDRETNAALFIRAQHMGELVEAAKPIASLAKEIERLAIDVPPTAFATSVPWDQLSRLSAILSKIEGGK